MESLFLKEIMSGNTVVIAIAVLALWKMHREVMEEVKGLTKSITDLAKGHAVHTEKLDTGDRRFKSVENHLKVHDDDLKAIRNHMHDVKNEMITKEQLIEIMKLNDKISNN